MASDQTTVGFACACGKQIRARLDQGGRSYTCTACGRKIDVPKVAIRSSIQEPKPPTAEPPFMRAVNQAFRIPSTFTELLAYLLGSWAVVSVVALVLSFFSWYLKIFALLLFAGISVATAEQIWRLLRARQRVLVDKDIPLLWGLIRLVAWDPVEGVLFLQNKRLSFSDDNLEDGHGGVRFIYPVLGEEIALRVPLEVQTLQFADEKVLTREYLSVTIRGSMKWRIVDIRKFYLLVSRALRTTGDHGDRSSVTPLLKADDGDTTITRLLAAAIEWLRLLAEEQTRTVVARVSSGLLIADRLSTEIPEMRAGIAPIGAIPQSGNSEWHSAADGLSSSIYSNISARVAEYGIVVDHVALQELRLPEEIIQQCIEACRTAYLPLVAQRKASTRRAELAAEVELLGRETVGTKEIVGSAPAFGLVDFISQFLNKQLATTAGTGTPSSAVLSAALIAQQQSSLLPTTPAP